MPIQFSTEPSYFEDCLNGTMVQATLRNKKVSVARKGARTSFPLQLFRQYLSHPAFKVEGIANFERAITEAFQAIFQVCFEGKFPTLFPLTIFSSDRSHNLSEPLIRIVL